MRVVGHPRGAVLGVAGPLIFLGGVILVSWSERDFMAELGWEHWPSGTALGPNGWATVLVCLLTGLCQMGFALSLLTQAGRSAVRKLGAGLLLVSGFGMAMLSFKTNHPDSDATWHATIHVAAYFTFLVSLLLAYVVLTWGRGSGSTAHRGGMRRLRSFPGSGSSCFRKASRRVTTCFSRFSLRRC